MTEIKLANGNNIEVTKQGLLIKGDNIRIKIGDTDVVAIIGDDSYSVHEGTPTTIRGMVGQIEDETSIEKAKTNLELEDMINELKSRVLGNQALVDQNISSLRSEIKSKSNRPRIMLNAFNTR